MIIAEIGINHMGDMNLARGLIRLAKENGADLVKSQLYNAEDDKGKPHYKFSKQSELSFEQAKMLFDYGQKIDIEVFFSVFDIERVEWCKKIGVKRYKIAVGMRDKTLLEAVRKTYLPTIISSEENTFYCEKTSWLYCLPEYPTPIDHIKMPYFVSDLWVKWQGFSDHTIGLDASKIALARGAQIIEKHFTIDKSLPGPDHAMSMTPDELKELVRWEKICQQMLEKK